jgi:transmembrane sensor
MAAPTPHDAAAADAIAWMVRLHSGTATPADHAEWQRWRQSDPAHHQAWSRLDALGQRIRTLPGPLVQATLREAGPRPRALNRRMVLKSVAGAGGIGLAAWSASRLWDGQEFWSPLAATHRTGVGEQARVDLADGSSVLLNTATALDVAFDAQRRCLWLREGELMIDCVPDVRPFVVRTAEGELRTGSGRFAVRQLAGATRVQVFEGHVDAIPREANASLRVRAGEQLRFESVSASHPVQLQADSAAWTDGLIVADGMRLAELVDELSRYRRGWLRCDDAAGQLTISGVYPVADPERVLAAIERTLPVKAQRFTRYWVQLRHA